MKAFTLLHSLTSTEKKALDTVIKNHAREQVKNLYQYLRKTPRHQLSNERMYETTYGHAYKKEKDYLLRNELRLLGNEIKDFLVKLEIEKELRENTNTGNYWYLRALRNRGLQEYYEGEYGKLYQKARAELQFAACLDMGREYMLYVGEGWAAHLDFERIEQTINAYRNDIVQYAGNMMRQVDLNHALNTRLSKVIYSKKRNVVPFVGATQELRLEPNDAYSMAMMHMAAAHISTGPQKQNHLFQALDYLALCHQPGIPIQRHLAGCYNALSLYSLEQQDLPKAALYAEKAFEAVFPDGPNPSVIYGNYLRTLNQAGMHSKAREIFDKYHHHFKSAPNFPIILTAYLEGEATHGDPDRAMELLPLISTKEGINYHTYKVILVTAYLRKNLLDLAHTEITNTLQAARENNMDTDVENFYQLIRNIVRLKMQSPAKQQDLNKLVAHLNAITPAMMGIIGRTVAFLWYLQLARQILAENNMKWER